MKAVSWNGPQDLRLEQVAEPEVKPGGALIQVHYCGVCGSDLHSYKTGFAATPGQILGHEIAGTVLEEDVEGLSVGDRVTIRPLVPCGECPGCLAGQTQLCEAGPKDNIGYGQPGGFSERLVMGKARLGETIFRLPDEVSDRAGALVEPLAVSLHAIGLAELAAKEVVVVLGAGPIGLGAVQFARLAEPRSLVVIEPSGLRRETAIRLGADLAIDPLSEDAVALVQEITGAGTGGFGARADAVIDCAGADRSFDLGMKLIRNGGRLVLAAMYGRRVEIRPDAIVAKEATVRGSMGYRDEFPRVIEAIVRGEVDPEAMVSHEFSLDDTNRAFQTQLDSGSSLKVLVAPAPTS